MSHETSRTKQVPLCSAIHGHVPGNRTILEMRTRAKRLEFVASCATGCQSVCRIHAPNMASLATKPRRSPHAAGWFADTLAQPCKTGDQAPKNSTARITLLHSSKLPRSTLKWSGEASQYTSPRADTRGYTRRLASCSQRPARVSHSLPSSPAASPELRARTTSCEARQREYLSCTSYAAHQALAAQSAVNIRTGARACPPSTQERPGTKDRQLSTKLTGQSKTS